MEQLVQHLTTIVAELNRRGDGEEKSDVRGLHLTSFDETVESFESYLLRLENYLELRNIDVKTDVGNKTSVKVLINCLGPKLFHTLTSLTSPDSPKDMKYEELTKILKNFVCPTPNAVAEQHKFTLRVQHEGETISQFQAELKRLSKHCRFICESCKKSTADTHLRTQFIRGVRDANVREKLLQLPVETTMEKCIESAISMEAAKRESFQIFNQPKTVNAVNRVKTPPKIQRYKPNKSKNFTNKSSNTTRGANVSSVMGKCFKCGSTSHKANECRKKGLKCTNCGKDGHIREVCLYTVNAAGQNYMEEVQYPIYTVTENMHSGKFMIELQINGNPLSMEIDTGAAVTTISSNTLLKLFPNTNLKKLSTTNTKLKTYTGQLITPIGKIDATFTYKNENFEGTLHILKEKVDSILGRDMIRKLQLDFSEIHHLDNDISKSDYKLKITELIKEFQDLFVDKIGEIPKFKAELKLQNNYGTPIFMRPRPVPYALRDRIENEIDRLESLGIIEKVIHSPWGTPVVPVIKSNGDIRLCADYKATINKYIWDDNYPIPKVEDLFVKLNGGKYFCTLDIHQAYLHMTVNEESSIMQAISTHKGIYKVKRLMFGVKVAPNTWQRFMDQMLNDLDGVTCFFDDIIIQGSTYIDLLLHIRSVLQRLKVNNLHLNKSKCQFIQDSVKYLGHEISKQGLSPMTERVEAILQCPRPTDVSSVRTFLGLVNYYQKFLPNLASKLNPINALLRKGAKFEWSSKCKEIFTKVKGEITSPIVLMPFNNSLPLVLATDASPTGLGAVISHITHDGVERPIAFASRSLTNSEKNYSQIDKEATAIYWGLRKFFQYCYGRRIILETDHKPLTSILHPNKDLPATSAIRLLHYANYMSGFNYEIRYRNTKQHANADFLSRFPLKTTETLISQDNATVFQLSQIETLPVTLKEIQTELLKDKEYCELYNKLQSGSASLKCVDAEKYSIQDKCIFRGIRVYIPKTLRSRILEELHIAHMGIVKMKAIARSYVWWKGIDQDIELLAKNCLGCSSIKNSPAKAPVHPWEYPKTPMQRVHIDYAGPFYSKYFLIIVDAYTKWVEVFPTNSITSKTTIDYLRETFSRFGLPITLVSDNGPQFRSEEFLMFTKTNGIHHKFSAPYHPATNGQVERYVQTIKQGLRATLNEPGDLKLKLQRLLMQYRKTPHSVTGVSPAELLLKSQFRSRIDLVKRDLHADREKNNTSANLPIRKFCVGDKVQIRIYNNPQYKWVYGVVNDVKGLLHYEILVDGLKHIRHVNQILATNITHTINNEIPFDISERLQNSTENPINIAKDLISPVPSATIQDTANNSSTNQNTSPKLSHPEEIELRRSTRVRRPPERLQM